MFGERLLKVQLKETLSLEVTFVLPGAGTPRSEILIGVVKAGMDDLFIIGPPDSQKYRNKCAILDCFQCKLFISTALAASKS